MTSIRSEYVHVNFLACIMYTFRNYFKMSLLHSFIFSEFKATLITFKIFIGEKTFSLQKCLDTYMHFIPFIWLKWLLIQTVLLVVTRLKSSLFIFQILCNDCNGRSTVQFHILGMKCKICDSYNTAQAGGRRVPVDQQWAACPWLENSPVM